MTDGDKQDEVDDLMNMLGVPPAESDLTPVAGASKKEGRPPARATKPSLESLTPASGAGTESRLDLIGDVNMNVRVELGRKRMVVQDILKLGPGAVVPLESGTADPLDIYVNNRLVARGEVLVVDDNFAVRITEVIGNGGSEPR